MLLEKNEIESLVAELESDVAESAEGQDVKLLFLLLRSTPAY
jgi:hypothetical protein